MESVLIVDNDARAREFLADFFRYKKRQVAVCRNGQEAISSLKQKEYDLIITDMKTPRGSGKDILCFVKDHYPESLVIAMSAFASIENAVEAMQLGAFHYLIKPFSLDTMEAIVDKADEHHRLVLENRQLRAKEQLPSQGFDAKNPKMQQIFKTISTCAKTSASVFISGESGSGKEVIASMIHERSLRKKHPFIKVNCPATPESLLESEFFGHEKGAFTGAEKRRLGRFELAHKGSLLLDEITEMPMHLQSKLLRVIQEQEFERLGSEKSIRVDIRFIATTNRNIEEAIQQNLFREDLFYRLHVIPIQIPPLRERREDIIDLANYFIASFSTKMGQRQKPLSPLAKKYLLDYNFPGNVRELSNIIERALTLSQEKEITAQDLSIQPKPPKILPLKEWEKTHILDTLAAMGESKSLAAKKLGITEKTLRNKLKSYGKKT